nr:MAG TPA: hypothetical protein [Caudoviricetes sp.]
MVHLKHMILMTIKIHYHQCRLYFIYLWRLV